MQSETILKIAEQGSAVIVGRCSDYILRNHENALNVFITAPLEDRMKRTCERGEATPENVEHFVNKKDKGREEYYNYYSFGNWGMAAGYDICINSSVLGIEGSADLIIEFARRSGLL
jgi:cytidylate kinase